MARRSTRIHSPRTVIPFSQGKTALVEKLAHNGRTPVERRQIKLNVPTADVLIRDPRAFLRFKENDVYITRVSIAQLERLGKGNDHRATTARQVVRDLMTAFKHDQKLMEHGAPLTEMSNGEATGMMFLQSQKQSAEIPPDLVSDKDDRAIIATACALAASRNDRWQYKEVVLVTGDAHMRLAATSLKNRYPIGVENFRYDATEIKDSSYMPTGVYEVPSDFLMTHESQENWDHADHTWLVRGPLCSNWQVNDCIYTPDESFFAKVVGGNDEFVALADIEPYGNGKTTAAHIHGRNVEQKCGLSHCLDPRILLTILLGSLGTGKTLLATAAGLELIAHKKRFPREQQIDRIIYTRAMLAAGGKSLGYLPGDETEKFAPWARPLQRSIEAIKNAAESAGNGKDIPINCIEPISFEYIDGETFNHALVIIDEAQNVERDLMKQLVGRAGEGTRYVLCGNLAQIRNHYLDPSTSGLTSSVMRTVGHTRVAHVIMKKVERSELAEIAEQYF